MNGKTFIEINYDSAWVEQSIAGIQNFSWLFQWGMYLFLILTIGICFYVFFDSAQKNKGQKALASRIISMIAIFAEIPAFIFRFTGNADGVTTLVRLNAEAGSPYYTGPINWNVNWLVNGYGTMIAIIAIVGVLLSVVAVVIYATMVHRATPGTEFTSAMDAKFNNLDRELESVRKEASKAAAAAQTPRQATATAVHNAQNAGGANESQPTVFDRKPQAATIIDRPQSDASLTAVSGSRQGQLFQLPMNNAKIGRSSSNFIVLDDGKTSREHAELVYAGGSWSIRDLGSANGTYLNENMVQGTQALSAGDTIRIGDTTFRFNKA